MTNPEKSVLLLRYYPLHVIILLWLQFRFRGYNDDSDNFEAEVAYKTLQDVEVALTAHTKHSRLRRWLIRRINSDLNLIYRYLALNIVDIGIIKKGGE